MADNTIHLFTHKQVRFINEEVNRLQIANKELLEALKDATERMDRCRMILVERDGQPDCWQILHTSHAKVAMLKHTPPVGVETK